MEHIVAEAGQLTANAKCHTSQTAATREGLIADTCHAIGDLDARQTTATGEHIIADPRQLTTNAKGYAREVCTPRERLQPADACHPARNNNTRQTATTTECNIADTCNGIHRILISDRIENYDFSGKSLRLLRNHCFAVF